ncbi:hypothetical protein COY90_00120 [Candidatus Roizmanbacteria bacterium CG_4_10_14_0_8_um_filter_39_9]|uniref:Peptidase S11 D-alanyl-D-alanine carboxypeptidase A N-terminal domain-containing protein n=1 Tax=Candidatus Roizmanbacteria bacterium CG_4_10_14_0_8_um_filter_39_9 TaxID=1974829 RepID=A0A2M7QFB5_9BACT|nr:MAG: hypothetical protein COY90_00120 [Candidatus Roizmanbacteria bacterium CG_4_10_14_0_8_um_filter_39_9]
MKYQRHVVFTLLTLLFLFYPGDSFYFHIFAYNRNLFVENKTSAKLKPVSFPYLKYPTYPDVSAQGVYIADLPTFTPVYEKNAHIQFYPASTTKIITALVVNDRFQPDDILQVSRATVEGQIMNLVVGERMTAENLLYGILVHSANDAAFAFADNVGYDTFITLMNKKAVDLHMTQSHFQNPPGLDNPLQYTTPFDLALAARELLNNKYLKRFVATKEITISDVDFDHFHHLVNVNKLLGEIHGIGGLKTGYTEQAGENLVSFYKKNGHEYIIVIMKSEDRFSDTTAIVNWINESVSHYP